jgi:hypothetical protein
VSSWLRAALAAVAGLSGLLVSSPAQAAGPAVAREMVGPGVFVTYVIVDPRLNAIDVGVAAGGPATCARVPGGPCPEQLSSIVTRGHAYIGTTANYIGGGGIAGLVVSDHQASSGADPHTTTFCVGDSVGGVRPQVSIGKGGDAQLCRSAVAGERIVDGGRAMVEGLADDHVRGRFWWSVQHNSRVQRTMLGTMSDGRVLLAVVAPDRNGARNGFTVTQAAQWMIAHGVMNAIALDGGHQADLFQSGVGNRVGLQAGEPYLQVALMIDAGAPTFVVPPPPVEPPPPPVVVPPPAPLPMTQVVSFRYVNEPSGPGEVPAMAMIDTVEVARPAGPAVVPLVAIILLWTLVTGARRIFDRPRT